MELSIVLQRGECSHARVHGHGHYVILISSYVVILISCGLESVMFLLVPDLGTCAGPLPEKIMTF